MAKDSKKSKAPKGKKAHQQGYVSFTPEDLKAQAQKDPANAEAYDLLDQAMTTSSHITAEDKHNFNNGGTVDIDDVYPVSAEETEEMDRLLDEAEKRAGNPNDPFFRERLNELRDIVGWSKERHWNFSWVLILGVLVTIFFVCKGALGSVGDLAYSKGHVVIVKHWEKMDTTLVLTELGTDNLYHARFSSANQYKLYKGTELAGTYKWKSESAESYRAMADTASTKASQKEYLKSAKENEKKANEALKEFNELNDMKFKQIKKMALRDAKKVLSSARKSAAWAVVFAIFFLALIPLYIYADRPYGWMESRHRTEAKVLGGIRKWGMALAGGLAGGALAMDFLPDTIVKWSDGSTTREADAGNILIVFIKIAMLVAAFFVFVAVSTVLVVYSTIQGLRRNYDWTPVKLRLKAMFGKAKAAAEDAIAKK